MRDADSQDEIGAGGAGGAVAVSGKAHLVSRPVAPVEPVVVEVAVHARQRAVVQLRTNAGDDRRRAGYRGARHVEARQPRGVDRVAARVDRDVRDDGKIHAGALHRHAARRQVDACVRPPRPAERTGHRRGHDMGERIGVRVRATPVSHVAHLVRLHIAVAVDVAVELPPVDGVRVDVARVAHGRAERLLDLVHRECPVPHRQLVYPSAEILVGVAVVLRDGRAVVGPVRAAAHRPDARGGCRRPVRILGGYLDGMLEKPLVAGDDKRDVVRADVPVLDVSDAVGHVIPQAHGQWQLLVGSAAGVCPSGKDVGIVDCGRASYRGTLVEAERLAKHGSPVVSVVEKDAVRLPHVVAVEHDAGDDCDVLAVHLDVTKGQVRLVELVRGRVTQLVLEIERRAVDGLPLGGEAHVHPRPGRSAVHGRRHGHGGIPCVVNFARLYDRAVRAAVVELPPQPRVVEHRRRRGARARTRHDQRHAPTDIEHFCEDHSPFSFSLANDEGHAAGGRRGVNEFRAVLHGGADAAQVRVEAVRQALERGCGVCAAFDQRDPRTGM